MDNSKFKAQSACYRCRSCVRFTRDTDGSSGKLELCHECAEWMGAENTLSDSGSSMSTVDREAIAAYILQMKRAAVAKGGTIPGIEAAMTEPAPIPTAEIPAADIQAVEIPAVEIPPLNPRVINPKRPYGERGQGRKKLPPEWKLQTVTVRVSPAQKEKLKRLGAEWLRTAIQRAREPDNATAVDSGTPQAQNAAQ